MALNSEVLNTVADVKEELMLETENQTLTDTQIENYLNKAHTSMISSIRRSVDIDTFTSDSSGTVVFYPYFNVLTITAVYVNDVLQDSADYELVYENDGVSIDGIVENDEIKIIYVPRNFKSLEFATCIVNILQRLNPFTNDTINPAYAEWREKKSNYTKIIKSKFGVANYAG